MIHHLSLPAENPKHVATVLAEILGGKVTTLFMDNGTWCAWSKDEFGTCIEIFPYGCKMRPGENKQPFTMDNETATPSYSESHAAISVELETTQLLEIANREGWRSMEHNRGPFRVVEFWLENRVLIEFFTPEMKEEYTSAITSFVRGDWG